MKRTALISLSGILSIEPNAGNLMVAQLNMLDLSVLLSDKFASMFADDESEDDKRGYAIEGNIAVLSLCGPMLQTSTWFSRWLGYAGTDDFTAAVEAAALNPQIKALHIDFNSPGGSVAGVAEAADAIQVARKSGKPVYGYVTNQCCSAALLIAAQCDKIYGGVMSQVGSIGAYMVITDTSQLAEKMGYKVHVISSGPYKGAGVTGSSLTDSQLKEFQRGIDTVATIFQDYVASGRKMKKDAVATLADGRSWIGKEAQGKNLLDGIVPRATVLSALQAYQPGRKAIHIAAEDAAQETLMADEVTSAAAAAQAAENKQLREQLEAQRKANAEALAQQEAQAAQMAEINRKLELQVHRGVVIDLMHEGKVTKADVEKHIDLRAKNAEVYDAMMADRPQHKLVSQAARERAVNAEVLAEKVSEEIDGGMTQQVVGMVRAMRGGNN